MPPRNHAQEFVRMWWNLLWILVALIAVLACVVAWLISPTDTSGLRVATNPSPDYNDAVARLKAWVDEDKSEPIRPECNTQWILQGGPTEHVIVLLHGLTSCPRQFDELGAAVAKATGANVVIPRMPYHGYFDPLTPAMANLTAHDLVFASSRAVDIARGLGKKITVAGLSINGPTATWLPFIRDDIDQIAALSPLFGVGGMPRNLSPYVSNALVRLPNMFLWWDPKDKQNRNAPEYSYPRFPVRAIAESLQMTGAILEELEKRPLPCRRMVMVTSETDTAIDRSEAVLVANAIRDRGGCEVVSFEFPASQKVAHDFIDPRQPNAKVALVYPKLIELLYPSAIDSRAAAN